MLPRKIKVMQTKSINFLTVFKKKQASPLRSYTNSTVFKSNSVVIEAPVKKKKNPLGSQAESCQVGSTVFLLEFISPTTCKKGRFACLSRNEKDLRAETSKSLPCSSSPPACVSVVGLTLLSMYVLFQPPGLDLSAQFSPPSKIGIHRRLIVRAGCT